MIIVAPDAAGYEQAAETLRADGVVAYPTETVYGLAVNPFSECALSRLFDIKGRDANQPVLLVVADRSQLEAVTASVSQQAEAYMEAFWPGPLSLLFPKAADLSDRLTAGGPKICIRCSSSGIVRDFCRAYGGAITSTSANLSGVAPAKSVAEIDFPGVDLVIDGGTLASSLPSTVYDPDTDHLFREGCVSRAALDTVARLG